MVIFNARALKEILGRPSIVLFFRKIIYAMKKDWLQTVLICIPLFILAKNSGFLRKILAFFTTTTVTGVGYYECLTQNMLLCLPQLNIERCSWLAVRK